MAFINARKLVARAGKGAATKQIGLYENVARWVARGIQLIFALIVVGFYAHRVDSDRKAGSAASAAWVYATFVAGTSCITCVLYSIPFVPVHRLFYMDGLLALLWLVVFGVFAGIFLPKESGTEWEGTSVRLMKVGVWIDLVNCLLWIATCAYGVFRTFLGRKAKAYENKIDAKLGEMEDRAIGKVTEKLPPGVTKVAERFPPGFVPARLPLGVRGVTEKLPLNRDPAHMV
ncbi:hypothetical protein TruAng_005854 [Truncatella angustata]|nr:hypothetical protein TruAng_005854 [Truncatella angustata]